MTPETTSPKADKDRLSDLLAVLGWHGATLARRVEVTSGTVYNWLNGDTRVPGAVFAYLEHIVAVRSLAEHMGVFDGRAGNR